MSKYDRILLNYECVSTWQKITYWKFLQFLPTAGFECLAAHLLVNVAPVRLPILCSFSETIVYSVVNPCNPLQKNTLTHKERKGKEKNKGMTITGPLKPMTPPRQNTVSLCFNDITINLFIFRIYSKSWYPQYKWNVKLRVDMWWRWPVM